MPSAGGQRTATSRGTRPSGILRAVDPVVGIGRQMRGSMKRPSAMGMIIVIGGLVLALGAGAGLGVLAAVSAPSSSPSPSVQAEATPSPSPTLSPSPTPTPTPLPTPTPTPRPTPTPLSRAPLTGRYVSAAVAKRHAIAIMIDDHPDARPQSGFNAASVVWHAPAEGGIPRYMLLFQDKVPATVGPVRSARQYYIAWAAEIGRAHV